MMGRTHSVHAEPTTLGAKIAGWAFEIDRDRRRLAAAIDDAATGKISGPVGTYSQLDPEIGRFIDAIVAGGPEAVNAAKRLVREVAGRTPAEVRDLTVQRIANARVSAEGQDGMRAFLEKRAPKSSNR